MRNVLANWGGYLVSIVVGFFLSPFVVTQLGSSAYGVWALIMSLTGYLGLLDLGVRGAVTRYVAKFYAVGDHESAGRVASSALAIFVVCGLVAILVSFGLTFLLLQHYEIPEAYRLAARLVVPLAGVTVAISLTTGVFGGVLVGMQRFDVTNSIEIVNSTLRAVAIVIALSRGHGLVALAVIQLAFAVSGGLALVWSSFRLFPVLRIRWDYVGRRFLRLIVSFSAYSFLLQVFSYVILYTDAAVIGLFLPLSSVTYFSIAGNLVTYARGLLSGISTVITPLVSSLAATERGAELERVALTAARYSTALVLPILMTLMLRGESFIGLWMGQEFAEPAGQVLWVLSLMWVFAAAPGSSWGVVQGISKHGPLVPVYLCEAACNLALSVILVQRVGIVGVAWATTIPNATICLLFWPWYLRRVVGIPVPRYVMAAWVRPLLGVAPFAAASFAVERFWPATGLLLFFSQVALLLPVALGGLWWLCLPREDRAMLSAKLATLLGRAGGRDAAP